MQTPEQIVTEEFENKRVKEEQALLFARQQAYLAVFPMDEKGEYSPRANEVLDDLAKFCRAHESTFDPNESERAMLMREGRREVWLRIEKHLKLSSQKLWEIYEHRKL
jgi:hypothetical protein